MMRDDGAANREETAHHEVHGAGGKKIRAKYDSPDFVIVVPFVVKANFTAHSVTPTDG